VKNEKIWYELDAFAKTYSSIISEGRTTCFRLSVLFSENVDLIILEKVVILLEEKYPFYNSELKPLENKSIKGELIKITV